MWDTWVFEANIGLILNWLQWLKFTGNTCSTQNLYFKNYGRMAKWNMRLLNFILMFNLWSVVLFHPILVFIKLVWKINKRRKYHHRHSLLHSPTKQWIISFQENFKLISEISNRKYQQKQQPPKIPLLNLIII